MSKQYIRPCPVRLIGADLREADLGSLVALHPCAIAADLDASIWLVKCRCGVEFTSHAEKLINREVTSCGQCSEADDIQPEAPYLDRPDFSENT